MDIKLEKLGLQYQNGEIIIKDFDPPDD